MPNETTSAERGTRNAEPKAETKPEPPKAEPKAETKPAKPIVHVAPNGKLTQDGLELLEDAITRAAETIADGLRQFIQNGVDLGQAQRGALENAFEAARAALKKRPKVADLVAVRAAAETVAVLLANHSVRDAQALTRAKQSNAKTAAMLELLQAAAED